MEIERIKSSKKITKKGKKCGTSSVVGIVTYMEKEKSKLGKLKRGYLRNKKNEEARRFNKQCELDPGRVCFEFQESHRDSGGKKQAQVQPHVAG